MGNHALVIATDPVTGKQYATRAGPGLDAEGNIVIRARYGLYNATFQDAPKDVHTLQNVGALNISLGNFANRAMEFANVTNSNNVLYLGVTSNSNSYAFTFIESLGFTRPEPSVWAPGWDSGTVSPSLSY